MTLPIDNGVIDKMINNFIEAMHGKCPQKHFKIKVTEFKERSMHLVLKIKRFSQYQEKELFENIHVLSEFIHNFYCNKSEYIKISYYPYLRLISKHELFTK